MLHIYSCSLSKHWRPRVDTLVLNHHLNFGFAYCYKLANHQELYNKCTRPIRVTQQMPASHIGCMVQDLETHLRARATLISPFVVGAPAQPERSTHLHLGVEGAHIGCAHLLATISSAPIERCNRTSSFVAGAPGES